MSTLPSSKKKSPSQLRRQELGQREAIKKAAQKVFKKDAPENISVEETIGNPKASDQNILKNISRKEIAEEVYTFKKRRC